ncbi:MAG: hypothetical protein ABJI69_09170 [Balneola sp.]
METRIKIIAVLVIITLSVLGLAAYQKTIPDSEFERISWEKDDAIEEQDWAKADSLSQLMASFGSLNRMAIESYSFNIFAESKGEYVPDSLVFTKRICDSIRYNNWKYHKECEVF